MSLDARARRQARSGPSKGILGAALVVGLGLGLGLGLAVRPLRIH